jgi:hypothetical protein
MPAGASTTVAFMLSASVSSPSRQLSSAMASATTNKKIIRTWTPRSSHSGQMSQWAEPSGNVLSNAPEIGSSNMITVPTIVTATPKSHPPKRADGFSASSWSTPMVSQSGASSEPVIWKARKVTGPNPARWPTATAASETARAPVATLHAISHPAGSSRRRAMSTPVVMPARTAPANARMAARTSMVDPMLPDIAFPPVAGAPLPAIG